VPALEGRRLLRPEAAHDPAGFVEHVHPHADAREGNAVLLVLQLEPRRAHAELEPPARDVVDGGGHLRHDGRMPVRHAEHEHPAADAARVGRHAGEQGQPLELRTGRIAADRIKVVEVRDPVVSELLAPDPEVPIVVESRVLRSGVDSEPDVAAEDLHARTQVCAQ
jgi:hypothetical protein